MAWGERSMRVSVVLTAYNGATVIGRQMDSIRLQTVSPDEVLICDDCSTDDTRDIVAGYITRYSLSGWQLIKNESNLGWKRNFMEGIRRSTGDIIFLADQDDRWLPEKLEVMLAVMVNRPEILLLSCDMKILYGENAIRAKHYAGTRRERSERVTRYGFTRHFFMNPRPGCSYAFRSSFFDDVQALWQPSYPHDEFLWLMAALQDGAFFYNDILMEFCRGADNASDIRFKDIPMQRENLAYILAMLETMERYALACPERVPPDHLEKVRTAKVWCRKRMKIMETRNPFRWLALAPYWGYYNSFQNCLSDPYLVLFGSFRRRAR